MEVVASLSQGRTAAAQCGLITHKAVPVIFEPPCSSTLLCLLHFTTETLLLIRGYCVFIALNNKLYKIHGTYIKVFMYGFQTICR